MEDLYEGARLHADLVPRPECHQHRHRPDVEDQDAPDDLIDRLWDRSIRILCLARRDADQLDAAEREHDDGSAEEESPPAVWQKAAVFPEVADVRGEWCAHDEQPAAEPNHEDNRRDLDKCHPELHLAVCADIREVKRSDDGKADKCGEPLREIRQPEIHIDADRRKLRHGDNDVVEPVVPAGEEARKIAPVFARIVTERAGNRLIDRHLAEHPHDEEDHDAAEKIGEHDRRSRECDGRCRAVEKPCPNRSAECDHLEMSVLEPASECGRCFLFLHKSSDLSALTVL